MKIDFKKIAKFFAAIAAIVAVGAAIYVAVKKLTAKDEPEYFDDNDFFECDNQIEIVEVAAEPEKEEAVEEVKEEAPKKKKAAPKKKAKKAE